MSLIRKPFDDREEFPGEVFEEPTLTQQHFFNETNINEILSRYSVTGVLPVNSQDAWYADISDIPQSYQAALEVSKAAQEHFLQLPAKVRAFFENDVSRYVDFVTNPSESDIVVGVDLGLFTVPEEQPVDEPPVSTKKSKTPAAAPADESSAD